MITLTILFLIAWVSAAIWVVFKMKELGTKDPAEAIAESDFHTGLFLLLFYGVLAILGCGIYLIIKYLP